MKTIFHYWNYRMKRGWITDRDVVNPAPDPLLFIAKFFTDRKGVKKDLIGTLEKYGVWKNSSE